MPASTGTPGKSGRPPNEAYLALMKPDEDWREIEDSTERRKIQNRLAQRAYRKCCLSLLSRSPSFSFCFVIQIPPGRHQK